MDAEQSPATEPNGGSTRKPDWRRIAQGSFAFSAAIILFYGAFDLSGTGDHVWGVIALGVATILFASVHYLQR